MNNDKQEQFTKVPNWLMSKKNMTDQDKLTLSIILSYINNNKECFIGNDGLSKMLGISKNAASNRIKKLEAGGYIKLHYTFQEGKKEIDRRYITLLPFPTEEEGVVPQTTGIVPQTIGIVSQTIGVVPQTIGVVPQTTGYGLTDEGCGFTDDRYGLNLEVLDKILDNRLDNPLDNKLKKSLDKLLDEVLDDEISEIDVLGKEETLDKVSLTDNDFDMFSTEFDDLAEAEFQRILNKNK